MSRFAHCRGHGSRHEPPKRGPRRRQREDQGADGPLDRLLGAQHRRHLMPADRAAHEVGPRVAELGHDHQRRQGPDPPSQPQPHGEAQHRADVRDRENAAGQVSGHSARPLVPPHLADEDQNHRGGKGQEDPIGSGQRRVGRRQSAVGSWSPGTCQQQRVSRVHSPSHWADSGGGHHSQEFPRPQPAEERQDRQEPNPPNTSGRNMIQPPQPNQEDRQPNSINQPPAEHRSFIPV